MNRKLEQKQWDTLYKMTHCANLSWECDGYNISLQFPYNGRKIIYVVTSDDVGDDGVQKTILTNDCYVTEITWNFLKKGFDEWRKEFPLSILNKSPKL